jgi:hypothetical protein
VWWWRFRERAVSTGLRDPAAAEAWVTSRPAEIQRLRETGRARLIKHLADRGPHALSSARAPSHEELRRVAQAPTYEDLERIFLDRVRADGLNGIRHLEYRIKQSSHAVSSATMFGALTPLSVRCGDARGSLRSNDDALRPQRNP